MTTPQLAVTYDPTADLRLYHRNPRVGNVKKIKQSRSGEGPVC
jgi:hypothetical protein